MQRKRIVACLLSCVGLLCRSLVGLPSLSAEEPRLRATLKGHTDEVYCVGFSPDGKRLASAAADETIKVWDAATGKEWATPGTPAPGEQRAVRPGR